MKKYLLTFEFRYSDVPENDCPKHETKIITIGVYDDFNQACIEGNKTLEIFESKFKLHKFPTGVYAKKERFSKNGGCFNLPNTLVSDLAYLQTPFTFYGKIKTLNYLDINQTITEVVNATKRYSEYHRNKN